MAFALSKTPCRLSTTSAFFAFSTVPSRSSGSCRTHANDVETSPAAPRSPAPFVDDDGNTREQRCRAFLRLEDDDGVAGQVPVLAGGGYPIKPPHAGGTCGLGQERYEPVVRPFRTEDRGDSPRQSRRNPKRASSSQALGAPEPITSLTPGPIVDDSVAFFM